MTIIFDLDGTLLNTIDDLGYACNYALEQTGYATHKIEDYPRMVGNGINNLIRRALPESERTEENILKVRELFVPYYNIGGGKLEKLAETVVSVDYASVKIVQVACGESAAVKLYHGTDFRRNNRNNVENHPFGTVAGRSERLNNLKSL